MMIKGSLHWARNLMHILTHLYVHFLKCCLCLCFCVAEVATGTLLDLAEGANVALVHSGTKQTESDPFMVHNHATENNNTVWVRQELGWSVSFSCLGSIRWKVKNAMQEPLIN